MLKFSDLGADAAEVGEQFAQLLCVYTCVRIQQLQPSRRIKREHSLILCVDGCKLRSKLTEDRDCRGLIVHEDTCLPGCGNLASQDDLPVFKIGIDAVVFEDLR